MVEALTRPMRKKSELLVFKSVKGQARRHFQQCLPLVCLVNMPHLPGLLFTCIGAKPSSDLSIPSELINCRDW